MARAKGKKFVFQIFGDTSKATESLRKLSRMFEGLCAPIDRLNKRLRVNADALKPISSRLGRVERKYKRLGSSLAKQFAAPLTLAGTAVTKVASDFETAMLRVRGLTSASANEVSDLNKQARQLGANTAFSAKEAADGMGYLAMAGLKTNEIISTMPGMLDLASAAQIELGEAADYASNVLTGFGISARRMEEVSDKLTYAFTNSNTNLADLHEGLTKVGGIASKANISFEESTALMMGLADAGHKGAIAGTALGGAFSRISKYASAKGVNEVNQTLARLQIHKKEFLRDNGTFRIKFMDFIELLDHHNATLPDYQNVFGAEAGRYIVGLSGKTKELQAKLHGVSHESASVSSALSSLMNSKTSGAFKQLSGKISELMISLGDAGLLDVVGSASRSLSGLVGGFNDAGKEVHQLSMWIAGLGVALPGAIWSLGALAGIAKTLAASLGIAGIATFKLGLVISGVGAAITGVGYAAYLLWENWELVVSKMSELWSAFVESILAWPKKIGEALSSFFTDDGSYGLELTKLIKQEGPKLRLVPPTAKQNKSTWKWIPEVITKEFSSIFKGLDPKENVMTTMQDFHEVKDQSTLDYASLASFNRHATPTKPDPIDINIKLEGAPRGTQLTSSQPRARISVDTGRTMVMP